MAAICSACQQEMLSDKGCTLDAYDDFSDGVVRLRIPYEPECDDSVCHDCGVGNGQLHHLSCDMERCPCCHGQTISCGCAQEDDEDSPTFILAPALDPLRVEGISSVKF
jgi:hypothetical protein